MNNQFEQEFSFYIINRLLEHYGFPTKEELAPANMTLQDLYVFDFATVHKLLDYFESRSRGKKLKL